MRSVLFAAGLCASLLLTALASPALAQEAPAGVETTHSTGANRGPVCEAEAGKRGLTGLARTAFMAECTKPKVTTAPGAAPAAASERKQLRRSRQECRDYAAKMRRLWGLARHKFVKRCRSGRNIPGVPAPH
jgi:hypothetical protein